MRWFKCPTTQWLGYEKAGNLHCYLNDYGELVNANLELPPDDYLLRGDIVEITEEELKQIKLERL